MFKQKSDPSAANARLEPADAVRLARVKARQRLIGAIVLLGIGILGFPLVFETQPRPIPVDIPIEIPRRDAMPPLAMPPARAPVTTGRSALDPASAAPTPAPAPVAAASATIAASPARTTQRASESVIGESSADAGRELPVPKPAASTPRIVARPPPPTASVAAASPSTTSTSTSNDRLERRRSRASLARRPRDRCDGPRPVRRPGRRLCRCRRGTRDQEACREAGPEDLHAGGEHAFGQSHPRARRPVRRARRGRTALAKAKAAGSAPCCSRCDPPTWTGLQSAGSTSPCSSW